MSLAGSKPLFVDPQFNEIALAEAEAAWRVSPRSRARRDHSVAGVAPSKVTGSNDLSLASSKSHFDAP